MYLNPGLNHHTFEHVQQILFYDVRQLSPVLAACNTTKLKDQSKCPFLPGLGKGDELTEEILDSGSGGLKKNRFEINSWSCQQSQPWKDV